MAETPLQSSPAPKSRRRRFQFSLRTLLLVMTLLCVFLGTIVNRAEKQRRAVEALERVGAFVGYDYEVDSNGDHLGDAEPRAPKWLRDLIGIHYFATAECVYARNPDACDEDMACLSALSHLKRLDLECTCATDEALGHIAGLKELRELNLSRTPITDAGLKRIERLTELRKLRLDETRITDDGLKHLEGLSQLQRLSLNCTQVTEAGLRHIEGLKQLEWLDLDDTQISDASVTELKHALPKWPVVWVQQHRWCRGE